MIKESRIRGFDGVCLFCDEACTSSSSNISQSRNCTVEEVRQILLDTEMQMTSVATDIENVLSRYDTVSSFSICSVKQQNACPSAKRISSLRAQRVRETSRANRERENVRKSKFHKTEGRSTSTRSEYFASRSPFTYFADSFCSFPGCVNKFPSIEYIESADIKNCRRLKFDNRLEIIYAVEILTENLSIFTDGSVFCKDHSAKITNVFYEQDITKLEKFISFKNNQLTELKSHIISGAEYYKHRYLC